MNVLKFESKPAICTTKKIGSESRAKTDICSSISSRTNHRIGALKAKFCEDADFEVHLLLDSPKPAKQNKNDFRPKISDPKSVFVEN